MASPLMKSVSGIRGIVGESVTPRLICAVGTAFAEFCEKGTIVIGRDTRPTGAAIEMGLESALVLSGSDVVSLGVVPTPTVQVMVEHLKAAGGIVISASHNPVEWNAFKLIGKTGVFLTSTEMRRFFQLMDGEFSYPRWDRIGAVRRETGAADVHVNKVLSIINAESIRQKKFKVALDSVNGAGSSITIRLLEELGCTVAPINCAMNGDFSRGSEPRAENLSMLSSAVVAESADIGFAQDPDADRLAIVDNKGRPIGEENTIALVVEHLLSRKPGRVVVNLSTTKAVDEIAQRHGAAVARTKVGEINVVEEMRRIGARIGGEGNGGVISPEAHLGRDSLVGIGYVLEMMAERGRTVSELVEGIPRYFMKKGSITLNWGNPDLSIIEKIKREHAGQKITDIDGLRIEFLSHPEFSGGWVHLRPSNTEPIFRIIAEGRNQAQAERIYRHFEDLLK
jgi:phosphomannomutase